MWQPKTDAQARLAKLLKGHGLPVRVAEALDAVILEAQEAGAGAGPLSFRRLRIQNVARCEDAFHALDAWSPNDWGTAFAGEAGEACNFLKKLRRLDDADSNADTEERRYELTKKAAIEVADAVIYGDLLTARLGIPLEIVVTDKFNAVSEARGSRIRL